MKTEIKKTLINYVISKSDLEDESDIPLDKSLLMEGIIDSFGIIELVEFIESNWDIKIEDSEFTHETMGSINKMVNLINTKI